MVLVRVRRPMVHLLSGFRRIVRSDDVHRRLLCDLTSGTSPPISLVLVAACPVVCRMVCFRFPLSVDGAQWNVGGLRLPVANRLGAPGGFCQYGGPYAVAAFVLDSVEL